MIRRKTLAAALASGALLPLALAVPAAADPINPPRCESHVNCEQHNPDGSVVRLNIGIGNGGNCDNDKLLLVRVRIDAGRAHQRVGDAERADRDAQRDLRTAQGNYDSGYAAWTPLSTVVKSHAAYDGSDGKSLRAALTTAQNNANTARRHLDEARESGRLLDAKIALLTGRINGTECNTPPTTVAPPPTTDVPPPTVIDQPPATIVQQPPVIINNPQVGTVPSGPAPTGGGALRDQVS